MRFRNQLIVLMAMGHSLACASRLAPPEPDFQATESLRDDLADEALVRLIGMTEHLSSIMRPIRLQNVNLCEEEVAPYVGLWAIWLSQGSPSPLEMAWKRYGVGSTQTVVAVASDSPASRAGIKPGDSLLKANGKKLHRWRDFRDILHDDPSRPPRFLVRKSGGVEREVTLDHVSACRFLARLSMSDVLKIDLRRGALYITSGVMEFVHGDDELAIMIALELAHLVHDPDFGRIGHDERHELATDRLGLYMSARAGYDVSPAPDLWARIAAERPHDIVLNESREQRGGKDGPHGRIAERIVQMRKVIHEIVVKRAAGRPLDP